MSSDLPAFVELISKTEHSAIHLEMRDIYTPKGPVFVDWQAGVPIEFKRHTDWVNLIQSAITRGVDLRRARIVSEPVTDFIRYEWETTTVVNVPAGEQVRWLPRSQASDLLLPGNDFWVFDDRLVRFTSFHGDGSWGPHTFSDDADLIQRCASAFEQVWERGTDHADYEPPWRVDVAS